MDRQYPESMKLQMHPIRVQSLINLQYLNIDKAVNSITNEFIVYLVYSQSSCGEYLNAANRFLRCCLNNRH